MLEKKKNLVETVLTIYAWCVEFTDDDLRSAALRMLNDMMELSGIEMKGAPRDRQLQN